MNFALWVATLLFSLGVNSASANPWTFSSRIAVEPQRQNDAFVHLNGAGRKHIAVSQERIAIIWEDDRSGDPQVYISSRKRNESDFSTAQRVSQGIEAYEPSIAADAAGNFIVSWEQDGKVWANSLIAESLQQPIQLSSAASGQPSVATHADHIYISWREKQAAKWKLMVARLKLKPNGQLYVVEQQAVESEPLPTPLIMPSLTASESGISIAWEDRRAGHTRILIAFGSPELEFSLPLNLNEFFSNRNEYDKGNGATRVSLAAFSETELIAAWMDKRRGSTGYGIYTSIGDFSDQSTAPNEKAHGIKGDEQPHYNPAVSGNAEGDFVVAWDDFREGNADIWLSYYTEDFVWSEDNAPSVASGPGEQTHPSIAMDETGNLHLLWIERNDLNSPGKLYYTVGKRE